MAAGLTRINFSSADANSVGAGFESMLGPAPASTSEDFDAAARRHLETLFTTSAAPGFDEATSNQPADQLLTNLGYTGLSEIQLTETVVAEYNQSWRGVPIYGARVGVEMTKEKGFVNVSGHVAPPVNISPIASISPTDAYKIVKQIAGVADYQRLNLVNAPQLLFRYDEEQNSWDLVYLFDGVPLPEEGLSPENKAAGKSIGDNTVTNIFKVFIDAHTGEEIARVPRIHAAISVVATGLDIDGETHNFTAVQDDGGKFILEDPGRKIQTYTMKFNSIDCGSIQIPGERVSSNSADFNHPAAIAAHANAARVHDFYLKVLRRNGIDNRGMPLVSCVECLDFRRNGLGFCTSPDANALQKVYKNAAWYRDPAHPSVVVQRGVMVYGQTKTSDGAFRSFAQSLDVIGHELTHGVTDYTSELEYASESGALNESYSDIFGVVISNSHENDVSNWNWELGEEATADLLPIRDLSNPPRFNQPDHMRDFRRLPRGERPSRGNDNGFVHRNSGIHNKAAFNLFKSGVFTWQEVIQMFYLTLTIHGRLAARSNFADSKAGMVASCQSLFASGANLRGRIAAVQRAFGDVGIV